MSVPMSSARETSSAVANYKTETHIANAVRSEVVWPSHDKRNNMPKTYWYLAVVFG